MFLLHKAARKGQLQFVENLLESGIKIDEKNKSQMTPLHCAAQFGQLEVAKHLVEKGAQIEVRNLQGNHRKLSFSAIDVADRSFT